MEDDFDPKEIEETEEDLDEELDDIMAPGKKKPKKGLEDDLLGDTTDSLDEMADAEMGEDEPYDDVDKW